MLAGFYGFGPATIEVREEYWENRLFPSRDWPRTVRISTLAIRSDGSRAVHTRHEQFHHYVISKLVFDEWLIVDAGQGRVARAHSLGPREFSWRPACPLPPVHAPEPRSCRLQEFIPGSWARRQDRQHLGYTVSVWDQFGEEHWLSPRHRCAEFSVSRMNLNSWGLPAEYFRRWVTSIRYGEPDRRLFEIPPGYRLVD